MLKHPLPDPGACYERSVIHPRILKGTPVQVPRPSSQNLPSPLLTVPGRVNRDIWSFPVFGHPVQKDGSVLFLQK